MTPIDIAIDQWVQRQTTPEEPSSVPALDPEIEKKVVVFAPLAFGRLLFEPVGVVFHPDYVVVQADGSLGADVPLSSEPVFVRSMALGSQYLQTGRRDVVVSIAHRSSEVAALRKAGASGSTPDQLLLGPPLVQFEGDDAALHTARQKMTERLMNVAGP